MGKAKNEKAKELLVKEILGKACLLLRSGARKGREVVFLLDRARTLMEKKMVQNEAVYYMTFAWYFALYEQDAEATLQFLEYANEKYGQVECGDLDRIDYYYIPAANMMYELGELEDAASLLQGAITICREKEEIVSFERKEKELQGYLKEVTE